MTVDHSGGVRSDRVDRWPRAVAIGGAVGAGSGCLLAVVHLLHRAPCPPNYVRLLDLGVVVLALQGILLVGELLVALVASSPGRHRLAGATAVILAIGVVALLLPALSLALSTFGPSRFDTGCWTF